MKPLLIGIALVASLALSSCVALPPPPGGGGRPVARAVYRPASPKPKKQLRKEPPRLAFGKEPARRPMPGRPGSRR